MGPKTLDRSAVDELARRHGGGDPATATGLLALRATPLTATADGRLAATIELHGTLCAATAPQLHDEIHRLIRAGLSHLVVDLTDLQLCTSHGLDIFDEAHQHLRNSCDGVVRLQNPRGAVDRVLEIVEDADPTFPSLRQTPAI